MIPKNTYSIAWWRPSIWIIGLALLAAGCQDNPMKPGTGDKNETISGKAKSVESTVQSADLDLEDSYIVVLKSSAKPSAVLKKHGLNATHTYTHALNGFAANIKSDKVLKALRNNPNVKYVEQDQEVHAFTQTLPTGVDRIQVDKNSTANIDNTHAGLDVDIVILDTGIDKDHPDLRIAGGRNFTNGPASNWDDGNGHGTHVAGIAAAKDNTQGVVGVAPGAKLWAAKVLGNSGRGSISDIVAGIDWVAANADKFEVANMSLGGTGDAGENTSMRDAIIGAVNKGVVFTVAAGNDGTDIYGGDKSLTDSDNVIPAAYPEVATISALADSDGKSGGNGGSTSYGDDDTFASFSNYSQSLVSDTDNPYSPSESPGKAIDLILPGVEIYSTYKGGSYETLSGTSMSSPHGAGLAALYILNNGAPTSADGVTSVRKALIDGGVLQSDPEGLANDGASDPDGNKEHLGWAGQTGIPSVSWVDPNDGATVSGNVGLNIDASDSDGSVSKVEWNIDGGSWIEAKDNDSDSYYDDTLSSSNYSDGSHNLNARVTDDAGNTNSSSISITIDNVNDSPTASFTYSCSDLTCDFDRSGSSDSDGSISKYEWDFTSDGSYDATGETVSHTYDSEGDYNVTLRVTDDDGATDTKTKTVSVSSGSTSDMYVWDISFSQKDYGPGGSFHDLTATITIQSDSDGDGTAESGDNPVSDASVSYTLVHDSNDDGSYDCSTDDCWSFSGTTDSNGQVSFTLKRVSTGDYKGEVTDLTHSSYNWNSSLDADNPDYTTVN